MYSLYGSHTYSNCVAFLRASEHRAHTHTHRRCLCRLHTRSGIMRSRIQKAEQSRILHVYMLAADVRRCKSHARNRYNNKMKCVTGFDGAHNGANCSPPASGPNAAHDRRLRTYSAQSAVRHKQRKKFCPVIKWRVVYVCFEHERTRECAEFQAIKNANCGALQFFRACHFSCFSLQCARVSLSVAFR